MVNSLSTLIIPVSVETNCKSIMVVKSFSIVNGRALHAIAISTEVNRKKEHFLQAFAIFESCRAAMFHEVAFARTFSVSLRTRFPWTATPRRRNVKCHWHSLFVTWNGKRKETKKETRVDQMNHATHTQIRIVLMVNPPSVLSGCKRSRRLVLSFMFNSKALNFLYFILYVINVIVIPYRCNSSKRVSKIKAKLLKWKLRTPEIRDRDSTCCNQHDQT